MSATLLSMIFAHLLCNALAEEQPLSPQEAYFCSSNFEELKLALNPGITFEQFSSLDFEEKAKVSVESYRYYKVWLVENADISTIMQQNIATMIDAVSYSDLRPKR